jgi:hypothetical protein
VALLNKVKLGLTLVTIAINVIPIAGILLMYQGNLPALVVPPEITDMINDVVISENPLESITFVDSQYDAETRTLTLTFDVTNPVDYDLTVNLLSAEVRCAAHDFPMGQLTIADPVTMHAGETARIDVTGTWTEEAVNHLQTDHAGAHTVGIEVVGITINVNGVTVQTDEVVTIPNFPVM